MTINLSKPNQQYLTQFIKLLKPISVGCAGLAIAGLAIYPLINTKTVEVVEDKVEKVEVEKPILPPAAYTIIMGESKSEVMIKFHNQSSEILLRKVSNDEYNCLLSGGGINCVLAEAYQPKLAPVETDSDKEVTTSKQQSLKLPDVKLSGDMMDNIMLFGGVGLGVWLLSKFNKQV